MQIRPAIRTAAFCGTAILLASGCNKKADNTSNFTSAINTYYSAHPACLWSDPIKFPVQADTSNASKTSGYDALVIFSNIYSRCLFISIGYHESFCDPIGGACRAHFKLRNGVDSDLSIC